MSNEIAMLYNDMFSYNRVKDDICRNCNDLNCRIGATGWKWKTFLCDDQLIYSIFHGIELIDGKLGGKCELVSE